MQPQWDAIWINATLGGVGADMQVIPEAAIAVKNGKIAWLGKMSSLDCKPEHVAKLVHDIDHHCITPGLIDCHTHIVYAGNRFNEFEMRLQGQSYTEIAKQGGGIHSTVTSTRLASEADLLRESLARVKQLQASGVTTMEIKSGYGLNRDDEIKMLKTAKLITEYLPITIKTTYLGAHTIPKEYAAQADEYVRWICDEILPDIAAEKFADAVDVFCESIAFNLEQTEHVFATATKLGLRVKCHAEQLTNSGSASLAAKYNALSADHLEYLSEEGAKAMAAAGTIAVVLPGAFYYLRETKKPPIDLLRQHQVRIAVATDCNPGTSPALSLPLMMNMACVQFQLTPKEAFEAVTIHAASALGIQSTHGSLEVGKVADLAVWSFRHPYELSYYIGGSCLRNLIKNGVFVQI